MNIISRLKKNKLVRRLTAPIYKDYRRLKWLFRNGPGAIRHLLPGHLWIDKVDVCITTKCNLHCDGCDHLIPYYKDPAHLDKDRIIASIRKMDEATDWFFHINILGGEPFLNPDLKYILEAVPSEKCDVVQIVTNATIIPNDPELFDAMRRKKVVVAMSQYPLNAEKQKILIQTLMREGIAYLPHTPVWTDFGVPRDYHPSQRELKKQYWDCMESCHNLRDGKFYACFRNSHGSALGLVPCEKDEYVDLLANTKAQNRKQLRRLIWRHKPLAACRYCLRGTDKNIEIVRGKQLDS